MTLHIQLDQNQVEVTAQDLPLHCPMPSMKLWNAHPRVYIDVQPGQDGKCPYCGTVYKFMGELKPGH